VLWMAPFALLPFGRRELPANVGNARAVTDGYRGTRNVEPPGFRKGTWTLAPTEGDGRIRLVVRDARTALVTVMARPRKPVAHIARALATVRIRLVDASGGRRLEARVLPANLSVPFAIAGYPALLMLESRGYDAPNVFAAALLPAIALGGVWHGIWWAFHHAQIRASVDRAMDDLEAQLTEQASATSVLVD
jgi:hypothetical protein